MEKKIIDLSLLHRGRARFDQVNEYLSQACAHAGHGNEVVLTGLAPIWMYLMVAHVLHGKAARLFYDSPHTGEVLIFDHSPF